MEKKIRTYHITNGFEIKVMDLSVDPPVDISKRYQNISSDEKNRRIDAYIDVYESEDGNLREVKYCNPKSAESMASFRVLWDIYTNDVSLGRI